MQKIGIDLSYILYVGFDWHTRMAASDVEWRKEENHWLLINIFWLLNRWSKYASPVIDTSEHQSENEKAAVTETASGIEPSSGPTAEDTAGWFESVMALSKTLNLNCFWKCLSINMHRIRPTQGNCIYCRTTQNMHTHAITHSCVSSCQIHMRAVSSLWDEAP